jgi:hypothetical protein
LPWLKNFGTFITEKKGSVVRKILESLHALTHQCNTIELHYYLEPLWAITVASDTAELASAQAMEVVNFVSDSFFDADEEENKVIYRLACIKINRGPIYDTLWL